MFWINCVVHGLPLLWHEISVADITQLSSHQGSHVEVIYAETVN